MKKTKSLILVLAIISSVHDISIAITRPGLNRESARLDALQMHLAIRDHTDVIGLDHFGGNPAGIVLDEPRSRMVPLVGLSRTKWTPNPLNIDGNNLGVLGLFRSDTRAIRLEIEGTRSESDINSSRADTGITEIAYNQKWGSFLAGASIDYFNTDTESNSGGSVTKSDPLSFATGIGWTQPLSNNRLDFGLNFNQDRSNTGNATESNSDEFGFQAILGNQDVFNIGFSAISDNQEDISNLSNAKLETDEHSFKLRGFWDVPNSLLQFGAEYQLLQSDIEKNNSLGVANFESDSHTLGLGAALSFDNKHLLGLEGRIVNEDSESTESAGRTDDEDRESQIIVGFETHILGKMVGRASFSYLDDGFKSTFNSNTSKINQFIRKVAVGAGIQTSENSVIDIVYSYEDFNGAYSTRRFVNTGMIMGTLFFGPNK